MAAPRSSRVASAVDVGCAALTLPVEQVDPALRDVGLAPGAPLVGADEGGEVGVVAEPGQADRDVGGRAPDVLGGAAVGATDDVDEQLADDDDRGTGRGGAVGGCVGHRVRVLRRRPGRAGAACPTLAPGGSRPGWAVGDHGGMSTPAPPQQSRYSMGSTKNLVYSLLAVLGMTAVLVLMVPRVSSVSGPPVDVTPPPRRFRPRPAGRSSSRSGCPRAGRRPPCGTCGPPATS